MLTKFDPMALPTVKEANSNPYADAFANASLKPYDLHCVTLAHRLLINETLPSQTIEGLAMEVGINRNKLHYGFKQVYGMTIHQFMEQQRMQKAQHLLANTYKSIKQIASQVGYCTSSRFAAVFKKNHGITPNQFRKRSKSHKDLHTIRESGL